MTSTQPSSALADAVAATGWDALLPGHRAEGGDQPVGRPRCLVALDLADGLALTVVGDETGRVYAVPLVTDSGEVRRALPGDGASAALVGLLGQGSSRVGDVEVTSWHHRPADGERGIAVDQTNESVIVGDTAVVKWSFVADEGPHPAPSLLQLLDRHGFAGMPQPWGAVQWRPAAGEAPHLLALVTEFLPGAVDGWTWVVEDLRAAADDDDPARASTAGVEVGRLVADFHRALASTARQATEDEVRSWRQGAVDDLERALAVTTGSAHEVLRSHETRVRALLDAPLDTAGRVLRVHGDLHVGQVLRTEPDGVAAYALTDFDGNPVVPAAQRVAEQPAALDVAGMAQSFVHAGLVVRKHHPDLDAGAVQAAAEAARSGFVAAYVAGLGDLAPLLDSRLVPVFALRQVCREFIYAATHLPRWSYVPEAALPLLLQGDLP